MAAAEAMGGRNLAGGTVPALMDTFEQSARDRADYLRDVPI